LTSAVHWPMLNNIQTFGPVEHVMSTVRADWILVPRSLCWLMLASAAVSPPVAAADDIQPDRAKLEAVQEEFFESRIRPVLADNCLECHGAEKHKAGLRLDIKAEMLKGGEAGPVVVPGKPDESSLIEAIRYEGELRMPPKKKLKDDEIAALSDWVKRGAFWPDPRPGPTNRAGPKSAAIATVAVPSVSVSAQDRSFWSLQPISNPPPPPVRDDAWPRSTIDRFILAKLEDNGLAPAPPAEKSTLIRRAYFDLIGLPPTSEEVQSFVHDDRPDAFRKVVDDLLASPHYGERWGRYWLDVARYGEDQAHSFQPRLYPNGFRYRDWVVRALNHDMPFDQFVTEQIAGDLVDGPDRADRLPALGFFACGPVYYGDSKKHDQYADRIDTLTRGFLGLTVACARCHDHKYDPIPTTDYYALAGVFASTDYVEVPSAPKEQIEAYDKAQAAVQAKDKEIAAFLKAEAERLKQKVAGNQLKQFERMLTGEAKEKAKALRAEQERLKKSSPHKYPVIHTLGEASQPTDMPVLIRGNADTPGPKVPRRFLAVLGGDMSTFQHGSGRLELAHAIASPDNPLTARTMVNRIWQHHFGRGIVATASNFGTLGDRPSHPELLDWLAHQFIASGWSIKRLHRTIMLSAAYQQSSRFESVAFDKDPNNALVWKMNRRRLDVEAWRDSMLAVAGRLDRTIGGQSVSLDAPSNERRTVYAAISRHDLAWMLRLFDFPDPNITSGGRTLTTVPLQQLFVLNSDFMLTIARAVAARLQAVTNSDQDGDRIRQAYLLLFGRVAKPRELELGLAYLRAPEPVAAEVSTAHNRPSRWERYTQALLASNEFLFVD
jgi:cytochrome c553/mono/diheme cytochrome c family protein